MNWRFKALKNKLLYVLRFFIVCYSALSANYAALCGDK